jgi:serine/threonine protein kinase
MASSKPVKQNLMASVLNWLVDGYWPTPEEPPVTLQSPRRCYTLTRFLAAGDVADAYLGEAEGQPGTGADADYLLKVSRVGEGPALLDNERQTLTHLLAAAGDTTYRRYLPALADSFNDRPGRRVNVFHYEPGFYTLEQVHEQHPALDGRHLAWIFNRLLTGLGFAHRRGTLHAAILPCHVLIHAADHGLRLVGWGQSVHKGRRIYTVPTRYKDWYSPEVLRKQAAGPATDLFLAARCLVYLAGGDPLTNWMPETVPLPMQRFIHTCLLETARMRPDDAWTLLEDFGELLHRLYGPPEFHELTLT